MPRRTSFQLAVGLRRAGVGLSRPGRFTGTAYSGAAKLAFIRDFISNPQGTLCMKRTYTNRRYLDALEKRVLVFDGAMGTSLQNQKLEPLAEHFGGEQSNGCNDYLVISYPQAVEQVHRSFLEAGVDVLETDTFRSNRLTLGEYGLQDRVWKSTAPPPRWRAAWRMNSAPPNSRASSPARSALPASCPPPTTPSFRISLSMNWRTSSANRRLG